MEYFRVRASIGGNLMIGGNEITEKQLRDLNELSQRGIDSFTGAAKPLTEKMLSDLQDLVLKRDAPFKFGAVAMKTILNIFLQMQYGCREPLVTPQLLKGNLCEQDAIQILSKVVKKKEFRIKNTENLKNDHFTGTPDLILKKDEEVEDTKCSYTLPTYLHAEIKPMYYGQGQIYMDLTGAKKFRIAWCLVNTPEELIVEEEKRYFFKFGCDEENKHYQEACRQLRSIHEVEHIPYQKRVKFIEYDRNQAYIDELKRRVDLARDLYKDFDISKFY